MSGATMIMAQCCCDEPDAPLTLTESDLTT